MAYFIPSYFQKRLLRYALVRLDFIDTNALNPEDLDISLGQKSVIELKHVGIRVDKLVERVPIPHNLVLNHASIESLRITIPADLHNTGIAVEVDGIDIRVELREDQSITKQDSNVSPSRENVRSRRRASSASQQDSSGASGARRVSLSSSQHVIPTSRDLAMSFLEAEPEEDQEELAAAIQSQSQYLQESTESLDTVPEESGIGMPGGFSLPSFVAKFFAGVADRLSINVKNITVSMMMKLHSEISSAETMQVMVKLATVTVDGLSPEESAHHDTAKRSAHMSGFQVFLLSESEAFSRPSANSSPKLTRSRSKLSPGFGDDVRRPSESSEGYFPAPIFDAYANQRSDVPPVKRDRASEPSSPSSPLTHMNKTLGRLPGTSSVPFRSSTRTARFVEPSDDVSITGSQSPVDNQKRAEKMVRTTSDAGSVSSGQDRSPSPEDLSQSKMFTHDEAQSMYMSAVSDDAGFMPGAWNVPDENARQAYAARLARGRSNAESNQSTKSPTTLRFEATHEDSPKSGANLINAQPPEIVLVDPVARRLVLIDHFNVKFPASVSKEELEVQEAPRPRMARNSTGHPAAAGRFPRAKKPAVKDSRFDLANPKLMESVNLQTLSRDFVVSKEYEYTVQVGTISISLDMPIARMLVTGAAQLNRCIPPTDDTPPTIPIRKGSRASKPPFSFKVTIEQININICQTVPEMANDNLTKAFQDIPKPESAKDCLLQFTMKNLRHELALSTNEKRQRLAVEQIVLGHSTQKYLYFVDYLNARESIVTSQVIRPDDLVATNLGDRFEVQVKPMYMVVDLLKVDDVLSRSGGLSSILDLGSSIASTGTITELSSRPKLKTADTRPRLVHFASSAIRPRTGNDTTTTGAKIDVRISGAVIDLVGSESSMQVRSSAVKLVSRAGNLRAQIDTVTLAGPVVGKSQTRPGVQVKMGNVSLYFKDNPNEQDLDRLLSLLTPSSHRNDKADDDIMVDTLIRQRRKGSVLQLGAGEVKVDVTGIDWLKPITKLGDEMSRMATVTKYLPEDDRPGILTFGMINKANISVDLGQPLGIINFQGDLLEGAMITVPSLMAAQVSSFTLKLAQEILVEEVIPHSQDTNLMGPPMLVCRFIADEMEPTVRIRLSNTCLEYTIPMLNTITKFVEGFSMESFQQAQTPSERMSEASLNMNEKTELNRKLQFSLVLRDSAIALNPEKSAARGLAVLSNATLTYDNVQQETTLHLNLKKASLLIIDDIEQIGYGASSPDTRLYFEENDQIQVLTKAGYVPVASMSNASAAINVSEDKTTNVPVIDVEFRNNLLLLESCADSTQTLIHILSNLLPQSPPSLIAKYRTEVVPIEDMLASFTGNAYVTEPGPELGLQASRTSPSSRNTDEYDDGEIHDDDDEDEDSLHEIYREDDDDEPDQMSEGYLDSEASHSQLGRSVHIAPVNVTADPDSLSDQNIIAHSMLDFRDDHFLQKPAIGGTAHRWNSAQNTYGLASEFRIEHSPLKIRVRDVHVIWNLFDGFDWLNTRDIISQAVRDIETRALAKQPKKDGRASYQDDDDDEGSVIGDFLFNSIYIGIPANKDPRDLATAINQEIGDFSETGSITTNTTVTATPSGRSSNSRAKPKKLHLNRSKQHKMTFELQGVSADLITFPAGSSEVETSIDIRVKMLEIFDNIPTSTWKKFATYMHEAGDREVDNSMVHLELLVVRPVADLSAYEMVMKLGILPLRLHVDQDALDFLTRFFEFKDDRGAEPGTPSTPPFIQRAEVNPIRLRLDFKPKRVDYGGLRSGRTTEFMNFFVLDRSDMILRRVILYGVSGFDRLGIMLNNIWTPDVKKNQLPGVLAGLAPIRSLVDVGSGVRDLITVPIREYRKDGRLVRSIQKGAIAFAKTTTTELVALGAKIAIGTQTMLQNAEGVLAPRMHSDDEEDDEEEREQISLYADQPLGIVQGLRGAYASLERDLLLARDAIVAIPGEVMASGSATGAAKAVARQSPTIILRPAIGASKAMGKVLLGAGNSLDKGNIARIEDKYKRR